MDFLNGYDSDEEITAVDAAGVSSKALSSPPVAAPKNNVISRPTDPAQKKRKLNISILPAEIQQALQSDSILDSDDEDDANKKSGRFASKQSAAPAGLPGRGLLSMLPKPKESSLDSTSDMFIPRSVPAVSTSSKSSGSAPAKSPFSFATTSVETTVLKKKVDPKLDQVDTKGYSETDAGDEDENGDDEFLKSSATMSALRRSAAPMFTFGASSSSNRNSNSIKNAGASSARIDVDTYNPTTSFYSKSSAAVFHSGPTAPTAREVHARGAVSQQYTGYPSAASHDFAWDGDYAEGMQGSSSEVENRRRRERNLENALLNGDLSAASSLGASEVIPVQGAGKWDSSVYREQKERELEVYKKYNLDKGTHHQPTKSQNRKHQITSLHFQAAKVELALMESKSKSAKSKYETQMKYGW